jgi:hypothetical protein
MNARHTPGPWKVNGKADAVFAGKVMIADVYSASQEAAKHDARLIAAAPQLVEALRGLLACPSMNEDELSEEDYEARSDAMRALRAAGVMP